MQNVFGDRTLGQRENQEDAFRIIRQSESDPTSDVLLVVADGMGGHIGGEIASNLAIDTFCTHFVSGSQAPKPRARLSDALYTANQSITDRISQQNELKGMGCTLLGALKLNDRIVWVSVGDSLLYLFRDDTLIRLNADHSLYGELMDMVAAGKITQEEADANPRKNALRSAVIGEPMSLIDINSFDLKPNDLVILASDGLDSLSNTQLEKTLIDCGPLDPTTITETLLNAVAGKNKSNQDNTTIVVYRHLNTGISTLSSDSKWKMPLSNTASGRAKRLLLTIGGVICALLALLVLYVAFLRPDPVVEPTDEPTQPAIEQTIPSNGVDDTVIETQPTPPATNEPEVKDGTDTTDGAEIKSTPKELPLDGDPALVLPPRPRPLDLNTGSNIANPDSI